MTMNKLCKEINEINTSNGWKVVTPQEWSDPCKIPALLALVHSEVSEALEAFRIDDKENFAEEMIDVIIRSLDICGGLGIDVDAAIQAKLDKNRQRAYKHGGKRV